MPGAPSILTPSQAAFRIFPAEMHRVQTRTRFGVPSSVWINTRLRFGSQSRRVLLFAWLTL